MFSSGKKVERFLTEQEGEKMSSIAIDYSEMNPFAVPISLQGYFSSDQVTLSENAKMSSDIPDSFFGVVEPNLFFI